MIKVIKREIPLYEMMGVFTEAPTKKKKKRIVNASASSNLLDFTDGMEPDEIIDIDSIELDDIDPEDMDDLTAGSDMEELEDDTIQTDDTGEENYDDLDFTAGMETDEEPEVTDSSNTEPQPTEGPVEVETSPEEGSQEPTETENPEATTPPSDDVTVDTGEETPDEPTTDTELDLGGDSTEDFTDGSMETNPDTTDPNATTTTDPNAQQSATKDDMRKFILYKKYMSLNNSIDNYVEKIGNISIENKEADSVKRDVCNKFREVQEILQDYMVIKYSSDSYVQCTLMYEKMRTAVLLLFEKVKVILNNKKQ